MQVLRRDANDPPTGNARLMDLGFDSLMAVQLRNHLTTGLGLDRPLPATLMFDHPTIDAIAFYLSERLSADKQQVKASEPISDVEAPVALDLKDIAAMSEEDVESLLLERLRRN